MASAEKKKKKKKNMISAVPNSSCAKPSAEGSAAAL
jgi:hypothetical protein